jgi:hemoglobin
MKKEIAAREDIEFLIHAFYEKVKTDPLIGPVFTRVIKVNWEKHLSIMYAFWENTLFYTGAYSGNPMETHRRVHKIMPVTELHFDRWVSLFVRTVDEYFDGEKAMLAKKRAYSIATVMKIKITGMTVEKI